MVKYQRYRNRFEMFLASERGRRILTFCYSWGASIVILGALCKILHVPYANQILTVALVTEALVFFIYGFERPFSEYHWEDVFPVLKSKNPLDRPDFSGGGGVSLGGVAPQGSLSNMGGGTIIIGDVSGVQGGSGQEGGQFSDQAGGQFFGQAGGQGGGQAGGQTGGPVVIGGAMGGSIGGSIGGGAMGGGAPYQAMPPQTPPSPQALVNTGMAAMGLNIDEKDAEVLAESIKKLNSAAEQIAKMADLTEVTKSYIDQMTVVSQNLEKFSEITGSLGDVSDSLINSCKVISGKTDVGTEQQPASYVENMSKLNENLSGLNHFYETQLTGIRSQMDTILHINAGLNRIRDLYDSSIVDSASFRNENERMAQLLAQLNQVYSRLLQAMTVNVQTGVYQPQTGGYQQPPYQGGYR